MTITNIFIRSNEELKKVIDQIKDDQWELMMAVGTSRKPSNLLETINYHSYDDAWVPDVLAGKTIAEVGKTYDVLRTTSKAQAIAEYDKQNTRAINAVQDLSDLDMLVHLSYGDYSAHDYLQHIISFRGIRIFDIAKLIGVDTTIPDDLVQALWDEFTPVIEGYRQMGVFPPAIEVSEDADAQTKLLALFGRSN